ncbi:MAG: LLM class F420-dependent oxidoreductase [Mycobacteriaceae bacterium]
MKLGLQLGYWGAQPPDNAEELVLAAESAGFDSIFSAESWGSDAFSPLAWWGSATSRVRLGTSIAQISARTPTSCAMHALTLDHLSGGRHILGLGVSGPQVVEGWYGQPFGKPLARTREYVSIIRQVLDRQQSVVHQGQHYQLPYQGKFGTGLGKSLKPITHPRRADLPIWLGAEGPKNVALAAEIADGWLPIYYCPRVAPMYNEWLDEGFSRLGARRSRLNFEIAATTQVVVTDDVAAVVDSMKPIIALYLGGMGAPELNFHAQVYIRMGYQDVVEDVARLFLAGRKAEAAAAIPNELVAESMIVGTEPEVKVQIQQWRDSGVTMLVVGCRNVHQIRQLADLCK